MRKNIITSTVNITTKATKGNKTKIILIRFHSRVSAAQQTPPGDSFFKAYALLPCIRLVDLTIRLPQHLLLSSGQSSACIRVSQMALSNWRHLVDSCSGYRSQCLQVQPNEVAAAWEG